MKRVVFMSSLIVMFAALNCFSLELTQEEQKALEHYNGLSIEQKIAYFKERASAMDLSCPLEVGPGLMLKSVSFLVNKPGLVYQYKFFFNLNDVSQRVRRDKIKKLKSKTRRNAIKHLCAKPELRIFTKTADATFKLDYYDSSMSFLFSHSLILSEDCRE